MGRALLVVRAETAVSVSTKSSYFVQNEQILIQDAGRYAIEVIARAVRQAGYEDWPMRQARSEAAVSTGADSPNVFGLDARSLKASADGIAAPLVKSVNGSDVLAIRFLGAGTGDDGDGTILNCAGFGVAAAPHGEDGRGWSIFYVGTDAAGEPELYCKYRGKDHWAAQSIARGVESFQVLYGVDTDADGWPNRLLNASAIDGLDDALPVQGANAAERAADKSRKSHWHKVVAVRVALLVRGMQAVAVESQAHDYELFGRDYANAQAAADSGVRIRVSDLPKSIRNRERRIFSATIRLRNTVAGSAL